MNEEKNAASPPSMLRRWARTAGSAVAATVLWPRLQLALKAALAAGIAFAIAPFMPGSAADYPYYAPLGALVAMYENVAGSMRQGLQTLLGLAIGVGLAFMLFSLGEPTPLTVAVVMGLGVILAGLPRIGSGRDWIPTAALLVLLVGGHNPDTFSFGYLFQMGVGVTVGIVVNLAGLPAAAFQGRGPEYRGTSPGPRPATLGHGQGPQGKLAARTRRLVAPLGRARSACPLRAARGREGRRQPPGQSATAPASA